MRGSLKISNIFTLFLGVLSLGGLIYDYFTFEYLQPLTLTLREIGPVAENRALFVSIGLIVTFIFHLSAIMNLALQFHFFKTSNLLQKVTLLLGLISFICVFGAWGLLSDIGKEYRLGLEIAGEWRLLYFCLVPLATFHLMMFVSVAGTYERARANYAAEPVIKEEVIFTTVHYAGIFCGLTGLALTLGYLGCGVSIHSLKALVPLYTLFITIPYLLLTGFWLLIKRKEQPAEWYDEKQSRDLGKAGLLTLVLSLLWMALLFAFGFLHSFHPVGVVFFPFYLFFVQLVFSASTLVYFQKM